MYGGGYWLSQVMRRERHSRPTSRSTAFVMYSWPLLVVHCRRSRT